MLGWILTAYCGFCRSINNYYSKRYNDAATALWFTYLLVSLLIWMNLMFIIDVVALSGDQLNFVQRPNMIAVSASSLVINFYPIVVRRIFLQPSYRSLSTIITIGYIVASISLFILTSSIVRSRNLEGQLLRESRNEYLGSRGNFHEQPGMKVSEFRSGWV